MFPIQGAIPEEGGYLKKKKKEERLNVVSFLLNFIELIPDVLALESCWSMDIFFSGWHRRKQKRVKRFKGGGSIT